MRTNVGGGGVAGSQPNEYSCAHGAQNNFGDLTPYLAYDCMYSFSSVEGGEVKLPQVKSPLQVGPAFPPHMVYLSKSRIQRFHLKLALSCL
jgi:hypothetical protein